MTLAIPMDNDNETAKIAAPELDHEVQKQCSPEAEKGETIGPGRVSSDHSSPSVEHTDKKNSDINDTVEAAQAGDDTPPAVKVPRLQRRGLFGRFSLLAEVTEPKHYSRGTKWWITFIVALAAVAAPMGSAIILRMPFSPPGRFPKAKIR